MKNTRILASLLIASLMLPGCRPKPAETAAPDEYRVTWVVDGDTIELGNGKRVRYLGIDTPEVRRRVGGKWQYLPEKYAVEAKNYNDTLVRNKNVKLEFDTRKEDKYGRWLAYVYVNDKMVNAELLREGLASVFIIPPNVKHTEALIKAQKEAQEQKKGIWSGLKTITTEEAESNIGKFLTVRGTVIGAYKRPRGGVLLNFKGNFQAAIFSRNIIFFTEKEIDPFIYYNNRLIEVTGKIEYIDGPKIIIDHPSQISEIKK